MLSRWHLFMKSNLFLLCHLSLFIASIHSQPMLKYARHFRQLPTSWLKFEWGIVNSPVWVTGNVGVGDRSIRCPTWVPINSLLVWSISYRLGVIYLPPKVFPPVCPYVRPSACTTQIRR